MSTVNAGWRGPNIVKDGLVLYLDASSGTSYSPLNSGTRWRDISGNSFSGSLVNGPTFSNLNGGSIIFDGVDDFVTGSDSANFAFGTGNFTVDVWGFLPGSGGIFVDLRSTTSGTGNGYSDYIANNKFYLYWANGNRYISTGSISSNSWNNITATRSSSTVSVYFNAILDGTSVSNTNLTEGGFRLARNINTVGTGYMNGRIGNVKIYNRALSATEVLQNYNATKARFGL